MSRLSNALKKSARPPGVLWAGPGGPGPEGGVTQSLLGRYLSCKERFRLRVIDGWVPAPRFEPRLEFGNMWHICEELHSAGKDPMREDALFDYGQKLGDRYLLQRDSVDHWVGLTTALFPEYVRHWQDHPDVLSRKPLLQEHAFDVQYRLPSGRTARLRGKWDSVDWIDDETDGGEPGVYLQENKTKSQIDAWKIQRQCGFDLQSMFYLVALTEEQNRLDDSTVKARLSRRAGKYRELLPVRGVRYNVIRRPAHKSVESAMEKYGVDSRNGRIGEWFGRWKVLVSGADLARFKTTCLDPLLENLLDDYEWWAFCSQNRGRMDPFDYKFRYGKYPQHLARHFRWPFGVYNPLDEAGGSDLDALLDDGSTAGLVRAPTLFPELAPT